jgi:hypothetical protein
MILTKPARKGHQITPVCIQRVLTQTLFQPAGINKGCDQLIILTG